MRRRAAQGIHDLLEMPLRVGMRERVPGRFVAEYRPTVAHGGYFAVARAEIESDAAAFQVPAQRRADFPFRRELPGAHDDDLERPLVDFFAHDPRVKLPRARFAIVALQLLAQFGWTGEVNFAAAARPKQKLQQSFHVEKVPRGPRAIRR